MTGRSAGRCACALRDGISELVEVARHWDTGSWAPSRGIGGCATRPELAYLRDLALIPAHLTARGLWLPEVSELSAEPAPCREL